jgi:two-component system, OmpR family, response regulator
LSDRYRELSLLSTHGTAAWYHAHMLLRAAFDESKAQRYTSMPQGQILIVDSDPTVALVTQRTLQHVLGSAAEVTIAPTPGAAWLRCRRARIDLVIVDPEPQNLAALALIKALVAEQPQLPVLVLTAYDTPGLRSRMATLGIRHYLAKPVEVAELGRVVREALHLENEAALFEGADANRAVAARAGPSS